MDDQKCGHVRLYSHDWRGASEHAPCMICERDELRSKLDTIRKLVTGLPPTGDPVLVARWLVDDLKEAAK